MGDYTKAEPLLRQAMETRRRVLGEDHSVYANSLNNLAGLYMEKGDYPKAEPLYHRALEIKRRALGENHPNYAQGLIAVAGLYEHMGDFASAEQSYRQGLTILTRWSEECLSGLCVRQRIRLLNAQVWVLHAYLSRRTGRRDQGRGTLSPRPRVEGRR